MPKTRRRPISTAKRFRKKNARADHGSPERWQHGAKGFAAAERGGIVAARAIEEHVIDSLALRGLIDGTQSEAAFKLKLDFLRAGLAASVTARYSPDTGARETQGRRERGDAEEAAYQRWRNAVRELGLDMGAAVIATACHDETPRVGDLPLLQKGLEVLALWYGLKKPR